MDEARSSCPGPTAEDTLRNCNRAPADSDADRRPPGYRPTMRFSLPLGRGQGLPRHQRWPWIAEDLFDENKW
jgi:hypothetical protein